MTWKDIKLATLQKMFSAEGSNIPTDDSTRDYLAGMPYAANEGLLMMCTGKKHIIRTLDFDNTVGTESGSFRKINMSEQAADFFQFAGEVYYTERTNRVRTQAYYTESNNILVLPRDFKGVYTVYYYAYPKEITIGTEDDYVPEAAPEVVAILPLYMASQLYKEDDNGIATSLRNEFEVAYERITQDNPMCRFEPIDESGW